MSVKSSGQLRRVDPPKAAALPPPSCSKRLTVTADRDSDGRKLSSGWVHMQRRVQRCRRGTSELWLACTPLRAASAGAATDPALHMHGAGAGGAVRRGASSTRIRPHAALLVECDGLRHVQCRGLMREGGGGGEGRVVREVWRGSSKVATRLLRSQRPAVTHLTRFHALASPPTPTASPPPPCGPQDAQAHPHHPLPRSPPLSTPHTRTNKHMHTHVHTHARTSTQI